MYLFCLLSIFFIAFSCASKTDNSCAGESTCIYKCNCAEECPRNDSMCPSSSKCNKGWFGERCQYNDLLDVEGATLNISPQGPATYLNDYNDATCAYDVMSVTVSWNLEYPLTWTRLVFKTIENFDYSSAQMINITMSYHTKEEKKFVQCNHQRLYIVKTNTIDIRCLDNVTTSSVKIEGSFNTLCSVYINGGRNLAYKQKADLSTTFHGSNGDKAVDGNTASNYDLGSCAHSGLNENSPKLTLTLNRPAIIYRILLYNRNELRDRLRSFIIDIFNNTGQKIFHYLDRSAVDQAVYNVNVNRSMTKTIIVSVTRKAINTDTKPILTICELEAYGECPPGKWGLTCTNECPENCGQYCHIDDGSCNVSCIGSSDPPECVTDCVKGKWGWNCLQRCTENCFNFSCDRHTGQCNEGCLGYSDPPLCTKSCSTGFYGKNCTNNCPANCHNENCNFISGDCYRCKEGYQGDICSEPCQDGHWGISCSKRCSKFCHIGHCNAQTGECIDGCQDGYLPPLCDDVCTYGTYGRNCSLNCSSNCLSGACNHVSGYCDGCVDNFHGIFCKSESPNTGSSSITVTIVVICLVLILLFVVVIIFRKQLPTVNDTLLKFIQRRPPENDFPNEENYLRDDDQESDSSTDDDSETSVSFLKNESNKSIIPVQELHMFLKTKSKEYFNQQFKKIPAAEGATTNVGLSEENRYKNRYKDIVTFDHSRVQLQVNDVEREEDYINASYIKGLSENVKFIASQGPNRAMINDFIRMLWEQQTDKVVMLTNLVENGKIKCERYWPEKGKSQFGQIKVNVISTYTFSDYVIRTIELTKRNAPRQLLTQYHFTSWPDKNVPDTPWSLVDFYFKIFSTPSARPIVVHCSAGVGRTGTFIALCNIVDEARETGQVNFFDTLTKLRQDRICMIQTADQYQFLHTSAQVAILCMDSIITHVNVGEKLHQLNKITSFGSCKMEEEYKVLCEVVQSIENNESINEDLQDDIQIYQNAACVTKVVKDRFPEFAPKESYRVHLSDDSSTSDDYIHAVYVQGFIGTDPSILTQLPMPVTVVDFWRCVLNNKVSLVVAFDVDRFLFDKTVAQYLPGLSEQTLLCPPFKILSSSLKSTDSWEERKLNVHWKSSVHRLVHLKCNINDVDSRKLLTIVKQIRTYDCHGNVLYMCKNGAILSGIAFILTVLLERLDNDLYVSVPLVVGAMKTVRPQVISRLVEYRSLYEVLERYIETSSVYNNTIDLNIESKFNSTKVNPSNEMFVEDQSVYANY